MTKPFDPDLTEVARSAIATLFDAYCTATRMPLTLVSEVVSDDRAFVSRYRKTDLRISSYDRVVGRFSALWPSDLAWPKGVPRPTPDVVPETLRSKLADREARYARASDMPPELPGKAPWPADIPLPASATSEP